MDAARRLRVLARRYLPPRRLWPWALPGAAELAELSWRRRIRATPAITGHEHAARTGLLDIEEVIDCSLCGEERMQVLFHPRDVRGRWEYDVVRCPRCGFLYRHPGIKADRLGELYAGKGYARFLTGRYAEERRVRYALTMDAFAPLFTAGAGRRLLDFGCGAGLFLQLAEERGFEGHGVDLSPAAVAHARREPFGGRVHLGDPLEVPEIAAGGFDVITLWSVMAHLPDPIATLSMLRGLLADDGVLLILTVNAQSLELKLRGADWIGFTANHLKFFAPSTLERALRAAGFAEAAMRPAYSYGIETGRIAMTDRARQRLIDAIDAGNRGNMLRAVAFASPAGAVAGMERLSATERA